MEVMAATGRDLPAVQAAYAHARALQAARGVVAWPEFTPASIVAEIDDGRVLMVRDDGVLRGVFTVAYADSAIWAEREIGRHLYIHRMARSTDARVGGLVAAAVDWAAAQVRERGWAGVRMDTWATNAVLIAAYQSAGFTLLGTRRVPPGTGLPLHYDGLEVALLEMPVPAS